ncbi:GNAT family N-acetyltransferase [Ktedonospora formicarum]|uniref:N-acetyltransferase domain-containing protein n=1 Tax=Ktedonospora formicarum TaxID=2778364 RepID=A0A8J3HXY6_9CHLR|nr:GNAT family N-acetyltransferase [Ktedonospora formicarum]GHO42682.1 hypothetical protein KSX_08450 [Ktedonospora formicarum]
MLSPQHMRVLRQIYERLTSSGIHWVITGSTGFALQGIPIFPRDIDIQSDLAGVYAIEQLFSAYSTHSVALHEREFTRSYKGKLIIDGIEVEIMGELQKRGESGEWEAITPLDEDKHIVPLEEMHLPVFTLEYEIEAYHILRRHTKAQMIQDFVRSRQKLSAEDQTIRIRTVVPDDAEPYLNFARQIDQETTFMMLEPGERTSTVEDFRANFTHLQEDPTQAVLLVAEHNQRLIGCLGATRGGPRRMAHSATIFIGILASYTGKGIGTQLFIGAENWARSQHLHRLTLDVMTPNTAGITLYSKRGFLREGILKDAYYVNGEFVDAYTMAKILD